LGRIHDAGEALAAADFARQAGFDNFNLDLMFGLPQQDLDQCLEDVAKAIEAGPAHVSCYQLTIEPNTLFHHRPPVRPDDETLWNMQAGLQNLLGNAEYQQYEVSAYARADRQCHHNLNYWQFGDYLGIGAGAHGKVSGTDGQVQRYWKIKHPTGYMAADESSAFYGAVNVVPDTQLAFEFMMNALRLTGGFDTGLFTARTGQDINTIQAILDKHIDQGLLNLDGTTVAPTDYGSRFLDTLLQDYLPE
ncbi:MAG: YggW family oxidoreductase, partial [Arenicella sp.]|nr:YggW family oxidoreductase [Arenicella sp.]